MKVTHLIMAFETGGSETMLVDIMNRQVENLEVSLIVINDIFNNELLSKIDRRVKIFLLKRNPSSRNIFKFIYLNWKLFLLKSNVIHLHNPAILKSIFFTGRKILTMHDMLTRSIKKDPNFISSFNGFNGIAAISNSVKKDIIDKGFKTSEKVLVINNGVEIEKINIKPTNQLSDNYRMIQVSRLEHNKKGQHILIKAIKELVYENGITNISLDFIGTGASEKYLKELVRTYKIENYVNFLGFKDREYIYKQLCEYDLFVQPSLFEGFGLTVAEAIAAKIPVLVSNSDGPMEIIENGIFGYSFENGSANDCAKKIWEIMRKPNDEIRILTEKAYVRVCENYSIKRTVNNYCNFYKNN